MTTATKIPARNGVVEAAQALLASRTVLIRGNTTGTMPMERRLEDGTKNVSDCQYTNQGKMTGVKRVRPLNFGTNGVMVLDPRDADDAALLEEARLWLADGRDARIAKYGVRIEEGGDKTEGLPFEYYDRANAKTILERVASTLELIGDAPDDAREFLEKVARYELQHKNRKGILDALEEFGAASGVEYGTDAVDDED